MDNSRIRCFLWAGIAATVFAAGCNNRTVAAVEPAQSVEDGVVFDVAVNRNLDILFVIDDSGSMANEQTSLAEHFVRLINQIESVEHGLPDLHIGVVSTDLGLGPHHASVGNCSMQGRMGRLQSSPPAGETCPVPEDRYIIDVAKTPGVDGERSTNYDGSLTENFACIARLGTAGCGFEQPLEAMRRALDGSVPENAGFLRKDARLAVIFVADEDDCSAIGHDLFDPNRPELGELTDYRCFQQGVLCDGEAPQGEGTYQNCTPREDSPYVHGVAEYVDFLRGLKDYPDRDLLVAGIIGENDDFVVVGADALGRPDVLQSCFASENDPFGAFPPVRLQAFLDSFTYHQSATICEDDLASALSEIGEFIGPPPDGACLPPAVADLDAEKPGVQPNCSISEVRDPNLPDEIETLIGECDNPADPDASSNLPCYSLTDDAASCGEEVPLRIKVHYWAAAVVPPGTIIRARCEAN